MSEKEEIVADGDVEIPGMEESEIVAEKNISTNSDVNEREMSSIDGQSDGVGQKKQTDGIEKKQSVLYDDGMSEVDNLSDVDMTRTSGRVVDMAGKSEYVEAKGLNPADRAEWIIRRISELRGYESINDSVKADIFRFDISDVSGSVRLFSDVMRKLEIKLNGDELYEEFQRIYDESVGRDVDRGEAKDKMWNRGRGR